MVDTMMPPAVVPLSSMVTVRVPLAASASVAPFGFHCTLPANKKALMSAMVPSSVIVGPPLPPTITAAVVAAVSTSFVSSMLNVTRTLPDLSASWMLMRLIGVTLPVMTSARYSRAGAMMVGADSVLIA